MEGGCCGDVTRPGQAAHRVPACPPFYGLRVGLGAWPVLSLPGLLERYFIPLERYFIPLEIPSFALRFGWFVEPLGLWDL